MTDGDERVHEQVGKSKEAGGNGIMAGIGCEGGGVTGNKTMAIIILICKYKSYISEFGKLWRIVGVTKNIHNKILVKNGDVKRIRKVKSSEGLGG